jgi:hypothetical protein
MRLDYVLALHPGASAQQQRRQLRGAQGDLTGNAYAEV